ncbi:MULTISPECIES: O-antigen ligase [unclassified Sporosarcina]|uniref:O-antigen ligase family protein n=1 Tax=unclassified Sporosarcina TaxID=2647733 RepID=UPI00204169C9|nr:MULTISPECIES: O-antigen polymerase [unclassified Sporosarcina]GKV66229.1 hypothetical protein NCCP2331_23820 [Sporosarcina sp. NCCP-2331]GLB56265.1 hypothetical protein NCCP2378_20520 [Sporosarcina sp. NCCP-2378]
MFYLKLITNVLLSLQILYLPVVVYFIGSPSTSVSLSLSVFIVLLIVIQVIFGNIQPRVSKLILLYIFLIFLFSLIILTSYYNSNMDLLNSGKLNGYIINIILPLTIIFFMSLFKVFSYSVFPKASFLLGILAIIANFHFIFTQQFTLSSRIFFIEDNPISTGRIFGMHFLIGMYLWRLSNKKIYILFIILLDLFFVFMSGSRQVLVAMVITSIITLFLNNYFQLTYKKIINHFLSLIFLSFIFLMTFKLFRSTFLYTRLNNVGFESLGRNQLIENSIKLTFTDIKTFFFGIGFGSYYSKSLDGFFYPHNLLLEIQVEIGLIGLMTFMLIFFVVARYIKKSLLLNKNVLSFYSIIFLYSLIISMFSFNINGNSHVFIFGFLILHEYIQNRRLSNV